MSGLVNALHVGKTSVLTSQKAIEVTGNNIANVNTPGYSRQTPVFSGYPTVNINGFVVGQGVKVENITRQHDVFLAKQINDKNATLGEETAKSTPLAEIERIISINEGGLASQIDAFFDSWQELSADPASTIARDAVIQGGQNLSRAFQSASNDLQRIRTNMDTALEARVEEVNLKLQQVADLNQRIASIESTGQSALSDRDTRDQLLTELSYTLGASYVENQGGMTSVMLPGGMPLVQDGTAMALQGVRVGGDLQLQLKVGSSVFDIGVDNLGGEFKGYLTVRDQLVPSLQGDLDKLAYNIATEVNTQHQAGVGLDGVGGRDFFAAPATESGSAWGLSVALSDPTQLAAGTTAATGDNTNVLEIAALGQKAIVNGTETFVGFYAGIASKVGLEVNQNELTRGGSDDALVQLQNLRDSSEGVSLEEEMINLIKFQKGFEASAKFLSTIDEMMDTLLTIKR
ncbi:flagellar hook-associated protein 1 [Desulfuromonas versatilis]|uniref:Flagellar hook-associated protein 1 n=1 Tax=Desulfuromonas versatilis TaxID=2802975 RepID=A0ABN6E2N1_9BACT|nr:flagellar hook-associated protein FlgK [Desulfuromonas versatilis]BCR06605.1 flagellar hook-associated protein 1 [Desulfuromonas versatilis]